MGLKNIFLTLKSAIYKKIGVSSGKTAVMTGAGILDQVMEVEIFQQPGVFSLPGNGSSGVFIPIGTSDNFGGVVCFSPQSIELDSGGVGGVCIYSTDAGVSAVKAKITLTPTEKINFESSEANIVSDKTTITSDSIELNGNSRHFVTHQELQTALSALCATLAAHVHPANATQSPTLIGLSCDISLAKTEKVKTGP